MNASASTSYTVHTMELGSLDNFIYLIHDHASNRAAVVDPAWDVPAILALAKQHGMRITDILLTHSHFDHANGVEELLGAGQIRLHLLREEATFWGHFLDLPILHNDRDRIQLGATAIEVLHTPGHTPGSACYYLGNEVLTGDTLFVFGCGRCDLRGGDAQQMYASLQRLGEHLPGDTLVRPGHNYGITPTTTIAEQIAGNPFFHHDDCHSFVAYRMNLQCDCEGTGKQSHDREQPYRPEPRV